MNITKSQQDAFNKLPQVVAENLTYVLGKLKDYKPVVVNISDEEVVIHFRYKQIGVYNYKLKGIYQWYWLIGNEPDKVVSMDEFIKNISK